MASKDDPVVNKNAADKDESEKDQAEKSEFGEDIDESIFEDSSETDPQKLKEKEERMQRNARRILSAIIRAMPVIVPNLRLKGSNKVANDVKIPYLDKFAGVIVPSYVIMQGSPERLLYFACLSKELFEMLKSIIVTDTELREQLCEQTVHIQFACPAVNKGFLFKKVSKGFLRGKRTAMYTFDLNKE